MQNLKLDAKEDVEYSSDPLSVAVELRDSQAIELVRYALHHKQVKLAYQPVVQTAHPEQTAFYEGLLRVQDNAGASFLPKALLMRLKTMSWGGSLMRLRLKKGLKR